MTTQELIPILPYLLKHNLDTPSWVISKLSIPPGELNFDENLVIETKSVSDSYLSFLREQIDLNPRGPEWTAQLQRRLNALRPLAGKDITVISIFDQERYFIAYIDTHKTLLVHSELF